jgi:biotin-(acetyl-CoA carboxylase) ligase
MLAEHITHKPAARLSTSKPTSKPEASLEEVKRHIERALHSLETGPMNEAMRDYLQRTLYTALSELNEVIRKENTNG